MPTPNDLIAESEPPGEPAEVSALLRSAELIRTLHADNDQLRAQCESFERSAELASHENERLLREIKRAKSERDHHMRAHTALQASFRFIGAAVLDGLKSADVHAYEPPPIIAAALADRNGAGDDPLPKFLGQGPSHGPRAS